MCLDKVAQVDRNATARASPSRFDRAGTGDPERPSDATVQRRATPRVEGTRGATGRVARGEGPEPLLEGLLAHVRRTLPFVPAGGRADRWRLEPVGPGIRWVTVPQGAERHGQERPNQPATRTAMPSARPSSPTVRVTAEPAAHASYTPTTAPGVDAPTRSPREAPTAQLTSVAQRARSVPTHRASSTWSVVGATEADARVPGRGGALATRPARTAATRSTSRRVRAACTLCTDAPRPAVAPTALPTAGERLREGLKGRIDQGGRCGVRRGQPGSRDVPQDLRPEQGVDGDTCRFEQLVLEGRLDIRHT